METALFMASYIYLWGRFDLYYESPLLQVSWYWKYLTELDCLWMPKCLKFGWYPTQQPSLYEETVYKRHYITTIYKLNYIKAKVILCQPSGLCWFTVYDYSTAAMA